MEDEKARAFARFASLKANIDALHGHAERLQDQELIAAVNDLHAEAQATWTDYLEARDWTADAVAAKVSGGEDKPEPKAP